jgi:hypothetical protein
LLAEMANQEHLDVLAKGVKAWNAWRKRNLDTTPDLSDASLVAANLNRADLRRTDLRRANLSGAFLGAANIGFARLTGACLRKASLPDTILVETDLSRANLSGAVFYGTKFTRTILADVRFSDATMGGVSFADVDLSVATGLESVIHQIPSTIGIDTIYRSQGKIPDSFLRGAGVPENFIEYMKSLVGGALDFYSCFISYSSKDQGFAERLHADLQAKGVRCWFAPHDIKGGRKLHEQIDEAIHIYDKLLLILSEDSMNSEWVKTEIAHARQKELNQKRQVLFPISLVPFAKIQEWECFDADTGKDSAREIREYFIPDFSNWKDHDSYTKAFDRLLRDLNAKQPAGDSSPRAVTPA